MTLTCKVDFQWRIFGLYINTRKLFYHLNKVEARYLTLVYTHSVILVIQAIWLVSYVGLGGEYKAEQNRCRELVVLPKFHSKGFFKRHEYRSDFEGKKRLHGV